MILSGLFDQIKSKFLHFLNVETLLNPGQRKINCGSKKSATNEIQMIPQLSIQFP